MNALYEPRFFETQSDLRLGTAHVWRKVETPANEDWNTVDEPVGSGDAVALANWDHWKPMRDLA